jgi:hypothetical protein
MKQILEYIFAVMGLLVLVAILGFSGGFAYGVLSRFFSLGLGLLA